MVTDQASQVVGLAELTGVGRLKLSTMLNGLDYHLVRKDGVLTFFHDYLRRAVEKRYLSIESLRSDRYRTLADFFEEGEITLRRTLELLHALESLGEEERVHDALTNVSRLVDLWNTQSEEVLRLWSTTLTSEVVDSYLRALAEWEEADQLQADRVDVLQVISMLFNLIGGLKEATEIDQKLLELVVAVGDRAREMATLTSLCKTLLDLGQTDDAMAIALKAEFEI